MLGSPAAVFIRGPFGHGTGHFEDIAETAGVAEPINSLPCWFWDYNNDGALDIFVGAYTMEGPKSRSAAVLEDARNAPDEQCV